MDPENESVNTPLLAQQGDNGGEEPAREGGAGYAAPAAATGGAATGGAAAAPAAAAPAPGFPARGAAVALPAHLPDCRAEWARLRAKVIALGTLAVINMAVPGVLNLLVACLGLWGAALYLSPRVLPNAGVHDRARLLKMAATGVAVLSGVAMAVFLLLLLAVGLSGHLEEEEEAEWKEGGKELTLLLLAVCTWHGSLLWVSAAVARRARGVQAMANPVSSGLVSL